jgi:hypothetical protein
MVDIAGAHIGALEYLVSRSASSTWPVRRAINLAMDVIQVAQPASAHWIGRARKSAA